MPSINPELFERLARIPLNKRDRTLLWGAILACAVILAALTVALVANAFIQKDGRHVASVLETALWVTLGLVFIFVAGTVETNRQRTKVITPPTIQADVTATINTEGAKRSEA